MYNTCLLYTSFLACYEFLFLFPYFSPRFSTEPSSFTISILLSWFLKFFFTFAIQMHLHYTDTPVVQRPLVHIQSLLLLAQLLPSPALSVSALSVNNPPLACQQKYEMHWLQMCIRDRIYIRTLSMRTSSKS